MNLEQKIKSMSDDEIITKRPLTDAQIHARTKHGMNGTPEYRAYQFAKDRCRNSNSTQYKHYGGRGIEFRFESFEEFFKEVGKKPTPQHSIERKNNNGHYEKGNVRWATQTEQVRNKRSNRLLTALGKTMCVAEWSDLTGLSVPTISGRINRMGWCDQCAVTIKPFRGICNHIREKNNG